MLSGIEPILGAMLVLVRECHFKQLSIRSSTIMAPCPAMHTPLEAFHELILRDNRRRGHEGVFDHRNDHLADAREEKAAS